jgi:hypothetical protein
MRNKFFWFIALSFWLVLAAFSLRPIIMGTIPFWYDPARDMLSAWDNLHKLTLIGSTSGIPGIFYGPYWIWFLSIPIIFSKDPRLAALVVSFIPYMFIFPIILFQFRSYFKNDILLALWIIFILGFQSYTVFIWNPNNSPLLFLLAGYLILFSLSRKTFVSELRWVFLSGLVVGLALNINLSFGSVFALSSMLSFFLYAVLFLNGTFVIKIKNFFLRFISYSLGVLLVFLPFFVFEIRHGFQQAKIALAAFFHGGAGLVMVHGLTKQGIVESFFSRWAELLHLPFNLSLIVLAILIFSLFVLLLRKKIKFLRSEKILCLFLACLVLGCLGLYISVRNPVWDYHFIGIEVFWILILGILLMKIPYVKFIAYAWILFLIVAGVINIFGSLKVSVLTTDSLVTKEYIVRTISDDAKGKIYSVYAYSPSIYTYEYSYLFRWLEGKEIPYDPSLIRPLGSIYLILPSDKKSTLDDFINYRTPTRLYKTVKTWTIPNGTAILKRDLLYLR